MIFSLFALVLGHAGESHSHPTCYAKDTDRATVRLGETTCETKIVLDDTTLTSAVPDGNDTIFFFDLRHPHCVMGSNLPANVTYSVRFKASDDQDSSWTPFISHKGAATFDPLLARKVVVKTSASSIESLDAFLTSCDCVGEVKDPELAQRLQSSCYYQTAYCDSRLDATTGWQPRSPHNNYLLIDLGSLHRVFGTVLKGFKVGDYRAVVKKYRVEWSRDNATWTEISGLRGPSSLTIEDIDTLVYANFSSPVIAQFVKIFHGAFEGSRGWYPWPNMRAGVLAGELKRTLVADKVAGSSIVYDCAEGWHHKTENSTEVRAQCGESGFTEGLDTLCAMECFTSDTSNDTSNNSYCSGKYQDKPYCSNNLCVECVNDTQCEGNADNKYCGAGNRCSPCENDSECAGKESGEYCSSSECVQCYNHTHCANSSIGNFCSATNLCVLCSDDDHCSDGKYCLQEEECVSCTENSHCSAKEECDRNNECITTTTTTTTLEPVEEITDLDEIEQQGPAKYELVESKESSGTFTYLIAGGGLVLAALVFFAYRRHKGMQPGVTNEDALHAVKNSDADAGVSGRRSRRSGSRRREHKESRSTGREGTHSGRKSTHSGRKSKQSGRSKRADSQV